MTIKLRHMEMATRAMEIIESLIENPKTENKKSELIETFRKVPSHIQTSGLGQTIAWLLKKDTDIANAICEGLLTLKNNNYNLRQDGRPGESRTSENRTSRNRLSPGENFLHMLVTGDAQSYRLYSRQALAFAEWLKRFADVEKKKRE